MASITMNPFYIDPKNNPCMCSDDLKVFNAFDVRNGYSLLQHLIHNHYDREEAENALNYLWICLDYLENYESAQIVYICRRQLESQRKKSFNEININEWVPSRKKMKNQIV